MVSVRAMYQFAIDMGEENSYSPTAPEGVDVAGEVFEKKQSAIGSWQLAGRPVLGSWYLVLGESFATLCLIGFGSGWPLGHPWATQARRKGGFA